MDVGENSPAVSSHLEAGYSSARINVFVDTWKYRLLHMARHGKSVSPALPDRTRDLFVRARAVVAEGTPSCGSTRLQVGGDAAVIRRWRDKALSHFAHAGGVHLRSGKKSHQILDILPWAGADFA